ncbi:MAG: glycosyltransferase family 2 protein [Candidatus Nezhaarchaeota archaeon]|nr:glycosyltransferase family 2 protein [Candidatus Nezhaarchaeota archaeon]
MAKPKVSILWLNYNSMHVIDVIKESLNMLMCIEYPNYELILVDNGSTDGSSEVIKKHVKSYKGVRNPSRICIINLSRNFGFTGGVNVAYKARDLTSKYVAIVNNDAIPRRDYLGSLVSFMESREDVGAVQGIVLKLGSHQEVDSAGMFIDESIRVYMPFVGRPASTIRKPLYVSYVEGTMPLYRVDAIIHSLRSSDIMYITPGFMYFLEDVFLSLMLWNYGYKCVLLPIITGEHYRKAALSRFAKRIAFPYYSLRNRIALLEMTNSKVKSLVILSLMRRMVISRGGQQSRKDILRAVVDGISLGKYLRKKYGVIDLRKVPLLRTSIKRCVTLRL